MRSREWAILNSIWGSSDEDLADPRKYPYHKHPGVIILAVGRSADAATVIETLDNVLRLFRTAASLYEAKIIAHATHCTKLTAHGAEEIPYPQR